MVIRTFVAAEIVQLSLDLLVLGADVDDEDFGRGRNVQVARFRRLQKQKKMIKL